MNNDDHKERHVLLHRHLDELIADWITQTGSFPSKSTVLELMTWAHQQKENPTPHGHEEKTLCACGDPTLHLHNRKAE